MHELLTQDLEGLADAQKEKGDEEEEAASTVKKIIFEVSDDSVCLSVCLLCLWLSVCFVSGCRFVCVCFGVSRALLNLKQKDMMHEPLCPGPRRIGRRAKGATSEKSEW